MTRQIIETHTGLLFDYADPKPEQVNIEDIAHALANTCRFGGHIQHFYSVAQHALLVRMLVIGAGHPELAHAALHHDSHEAYVGDVPTPLKRAMGLRSDTYRVMTERVNHAVAQHLGLSVVEFENPAIHVADEMALRMEAATLKVNDGLSFAEACGVEPLAPVPGAVAPMLPADAKAAFLDAHEWGS